jgi:hypothetical protein
MRMAFMSSEGMGRAFSPHRIHLAMDLGRWPRLVWQWAFGPQIRKVRQSKASPFFRANGASPYQPGASPQEWSHTRNQRAEGPNQPIARDDDGDHFRGVAKMVPQVITQRNPAAGFYQRSSRQGFLDDSNRRRSRVTEDSSATENPAARDVIAPRSRGKGTVKESLIAPIEHWRRGTAEDSSVVQRAGGNDVLGLRGIRIGRAFSPRELVSTGFLGRCPRLVWRWAFGPETQTAPTARLHTSLGQGPRFATPTQIEG